MSKMNTQIPFSQSQISELIFPPLVLSLTPRPHLTLTYFLKIIMINNNWLLDRDSEKEFKRVYEFPAAY